MKNGHFIFFIFSVFCLVPCAKVHAKVQDAPVVLVTFFKPYLGGTVNNSKSVAGDLVGRLQKQGAVVYLCELDTVYNTAFKQSTACERKVKPDLKISLGMGDGCGTQIELVAHNINSYPYADNKGTVLENEWIKVGAPEKLFANTETISTYCALSRTTRQQLKVSKNAGTFVCNNTLYHEFLKNNEQKFFFAHVPSNSCQGNQESLVRKPAKLLAELVKAALNSHAGHQQECIENIQGTLN